MNDRPDPTPDTKIRFPVAIRSLRLGAVLVTLALAQAAESTIDASPDPTDRRVTYEPSFFAEYRPLTALDMVRQVPGFNVVEGGGGRGLGGDSGNVLIDGRRPSAKQDRLSAQLQRIPADRVAAVELVRAGAPGLDVETGRTVVNVRLKPGAARSWAWSATVEQDTDSGGPTPGGRISVSDTLGDTRIRVGLRAGTSFVGNRAVELIDAPMADEVSRPLERRRDAERFEGRSLDLNVNTDSRFGSGRSLRAHAELGVSTDRNLERSLRATAGAGSERREQRGDTQRNRAELGLDYQWRPGDAAEGPWRARLIGLARRSEDADFDAQFQRFGDQPPFEARRSKVDAVATETVLRTEWTWTGWDGHRLRLDLETAWNALDSELALAADSGDGLQPVFVPGGSTRVEEWRTDGRLHDRFRWQGLIVEPSLGAEHSVIRQAGTGEREQQFSFIKPALALVHAPASEIRNRLRIERTVGQLDFGDFVSSADFQDDELDFGNPDLGPQQTWIAELVHERRFGRIGVASIRAFHHWVDDVQDRLPVGLGSETPIDVAGNIGDGRRWGLALETTLPLNPIGFDTARVDVTARWEDSRVTDPVTGRHRPFSGQREYRLGTRLRHDLADGGWAWGIETDYAAPARFFGVDEIDRYENGIDVEAFVETTIDSARLPALKLRLLAQNLTDRPFERERLRFDGDRSAVAAPSTRERRVLKRDRSVLLSVSGTF